MAQVTSRMTEEVQALPNYICRDWRSGSMAQLHLQGLRKCKQGPVTSAGTEEVQARPSYIWRDWGSASKAQLHLQGLKKYRQGRYIRKDWSSASKAQLHLQRLMKDKHCPMIYGDHKYCPIASGGTEEVQVPSSKLRCSVLYDSFSN